MKSSATLAIAAATMAVLALTAVVTLRPAPAPPAAPASTLELLRYLPRGAVTDASVDYTAEVQTALDAASGRTLLLPPFPVLVSAPPGRKHCLVVDHPLRLVGDVGSSLVERSGRVQLLRVENTRGVRLEGLTLQGAGGVGVRLAHGLLQVWSCADVRLRDVTVRGADADAIAIADSENVRVEGCLVERSSKAGIYLSNCSAAVVTGNIVRDTLGHVSPSGTLVGAGISLLSNVDVVCSSNTIVGGVGAGILCGSNDLQRATQGVAIVGNRIRDVSNPSNASTSSGIQLANVQPEHDTHVLVAANSIEHCGQHGILVDHHDGALIEGNSIRGAWLSAIAVGHARGVHVADNSLIDANQAGASGQAGVYLHATTSGCVVAGNVVAAFTAAPLPAALDRASPGSNRVQ